MEIKGRNLCDYCFEPLEPWQVCPNCHLTKETYRTDIGLLKPGTVLLGKYVIGRVLGRGGFGATYLAYSNDGDKRVAIKEYLPVGIAQRADGEERVVLVSEDKKKVFQNGAKRFFEEAKTMSRFNRNKNVATVYEFFYANDTVYYTMEYLEGIDLKGFVKKRGGKISQGQAFNIMSSTASALKDIHSTGTLHRDISPDNIFICTDRTVKLIDFGAAKQVVGEQSQSLSVILKQGFAPIEQYQKDGKQGMWTDIYALGATIYYSVTGKLPDDAMTRLEEPDVIFEPDLNINPEFAKLINKCMQPRPEKRYRNALELMDALEELSIKKESVGGDDYRASVYSGGSCKTLIDGGGTIDLYGDERQGAYKPHDNTSPVSSSVANTSTSQYVQSVYRQPLYGTSYLQSERSRRNNSAARWIIIGAAIMVILIILIIVIVVATRQPNMPMVPPPMGGPGGPPPMGAPMG